MCCYKTQKRAKMVHLGARKTLPSLVWSRFTPIKYLPVWIITLFSSQLTLIKIHAHTLAQSTDANIILVFEDFGNSTTKKNPKVSLRNLYYYIRLIDIPVTKSKPESLFTFPSWGSVVKWKIFQKPVKGTFMSNISILWFSERPNKIEEVSLVTKYCTYFHMTRLKRFTLFCPTIPLYNTRCRTNLPGWIIFLVRSANLPNTLFPVRDGA